MSFVSIRFPIFLTLALLAFFVSPKKYRWRALLASSYAFYWLLGGWFALAMISSTIATVYFSGLWIAFLREKKAKRAVRRTPLAICLILNFGLLLFLKFSNIFIPNAGILLIPGISFYTFQAAGYLIDIYKGKAEALKNPLKTALFLSFFPQLIQGPISRYENLAEDLFAGRDWDWERSRRGVQRLIWGYFMKFVIANHAAPVVNTALGDYSSHGGTLILFATFVYSVQIYADFAGGINIALGVGEIVGVKLPENFRQPFFANSLADFWRRWHMTLGAWLKDYMFYPMAISRPLGKLGKFTRKIFGARIGKMLPAGVATFCVYLVMGVWHGSGANLFVFGILNGLIITASLYMEPVIKKMRVKTKFDGSKGVGKILAVFRTLALLTILRYFARADSLTTALKMLRHTVFHPRIRELWNGALLNLGLSGFDYLLLGAGAAALLIRDVYAERGRDCRELLNGRGPFVQFSAILAALLMITFFGIYSDSALSAEFIYAQY